MSQNSTSFGRSPFWRKVLVLTLIITFFLSILTTASAEETVGAASAPALSADVTDNNVDNSLQMAFTDDPVWASAITSIDINRSSDGWHCILDSSKYLIATGTVTINPGVIIVPGEYTITVHSSSYPDAVCNQTVQAGSANAAQTTISSVAGPVEEGGLLTAQPTVTMKDQFGNPCTSGPSSESTVTAIANYTGSWALGGTTSVNAINGTAFFTDLTARSLLFDGLSSASMRFSFSGQSKDSNNFSIPLAIPSPPPIPPTVDTTPPVWAIGYPRAASISASGINILLKSNENVTVYYVVLPDNAAVPTAVEVKAGTGAGGTASLASGSLALSANNEASAAITGLNAATPYDTYIVANDTAANLQSQPVKVDVATASNANPNPNPTTPMTITFEPVNGATGVSKLVAPSISFTKAITNDNGSEINNSNVTALISLKKGSVSGVEVGSTVSINAEKTRIVVSPTTALDNNQLYYFALVKTVKSGDGDLVAAQSISFTTTASTTIIPCKLSDLKVNGSTVAGFSSNILEYTMAQASNSVPQVSANPVSSEAQVEITQATAVPGQAFVRVTGTGQQTYTITFTLSAGGPQVEATNPGPGDTGAETDQPVSIKFTKDIVLGDKAYDISIKNGDNVVIPNKTIINTVLILAPTTSFNPNTTYTVKIPAGGVKDKDGNSLAADYTMSFTTGASSERQDDNPPIENQSVYVTSVTLDKHNLTLAVGGNNDVLNITILPSNATNPNVTWSSSNQNVVMVNNGIVTPKGQGTAVISVISNEGGKSDTCNVTVNPAGTINTVQTTTAPMNETLQIAAEPLVQRPVMKSNSMVFRDIAGSPAANAINNLVARGIIGGYPDGTFKPNQTLTRLDLLVLVGKAAGLRPENKGPLKFSDAKLIPAWAKGYVVAAVKAGVLPPTWNGRLAPSAKANRAEIVYIIGRTLKARLDLPVKLLFRDKIPAWASNYISWAVINKIVSGYGDRTFRADKPVSRADICIILSRAFVKN
ncbi:MAG: S-layer homology domain-containing protein [Acidobacteriota bacterium]